MKLAIDTETTGNRFRLGDAPYYISTCDEEGYLKCWRFPVNPRTRAVEIRRKDIKGVLQYILDPRFDTYVFHNAKFDLTALEAIDIDLRHYPIEDTTHLAHLVDNRESRKLKDLSSLYLNGEGSDWLNDDETGLLQSINQARRYLRSIKSDWAMTPGEEAENQEGGEHWMKVDAWIPGQLARLDRTWNDLPREVVLSWVDCLEKYGTKDAQRTMALCILLHRYLQSESLSNPDWVKALKVQTDSFPVFMEMERYGVSLRLDALNEGIAHFNDRSDKLTEDLQELSSIPDFNPRSPPQLRHLLYDIRSLPILGRTPGGEPGTSEPILMELLQSTRDKSKSQVILKKLLAHRKCDMMIRYLGTYERFKIGSRIYSSFNQTGTDTTRSSSSKPNMQNVGKGEEYDDSKADILGEVVEDDYLLRRIFGPQSGRIWLDYDYDQLQLRIFAYLSQDRSLLKAFEDGWDAHNFMASKIFNTDQPSKLQRRIAKNVNFGFIFGAGAAKIAKTCGDPTIWPVVNKLFPDAVNYLESTIKEVRKTGKVVIAGYPLSVPRDYNGEIKAYTGVVYKVQGLEGLIVKRAMKLCHDSIQDFNDLHPVSPKEKLPFAFTSLLVHDELIFDFKRLKRVEGLKPYGTTLRECMEQAGKDFGVVTPASCSVVETSWDKGVEVKW